MAALLRCLLLILPSCADALQAPTLLRATPHPTIRRTSVPHAAKKSSKFFTRTRLDFASWDHGEHEFGIQGHIFGLAPQADSYVLIAMAYFLARRSVIPLADLAFGVGFPAYLVLSNWILFNANVGHERPYKALLREGRGAWHKRYILTYTVAGLLLPLPLVLFAPPAIAAAAAPHLFLALAQAAFEGLTSHRHFAAVLRLAVPIGFNIYRLGAIQTWAASALASARTVAGGGAMVSSSWAWMSLALAVANGAIWTYHLFVYLLLRVAPQYVDARISTTPLDFRWVGGLLPIRARQPEATAKAEALDVDGGSGSIG